MHISLYVQLPTEEQYVLPYFYVTIMFSDPTPGDAIKELKDFLVPIL